MKLIKNKEAPRVVIGISGKIVHMNLTALKELSELELGTSIFDIIDADIIRKLSMHKKKVELVRANLAKYPYASIRLGERARTKRIEITFYGSALVGEDGALRALELYSEKNLPNSSTCIDTFESLSYIFDTLSKRKELLCTKFDIECESNFYAKLGQAQAELLFLLTALFANEISESKRIKVCITKPTVEIRLDTLDTHFAKSLDELLYIYPQTASRLMLIESICEDEFINVSVVKNARALTISYKIPQGAENELIVKAKSVYSEQRIEFFIDTLLP